jgi:hypothetical protein
MASGIGFLPHASQPEEVANLLSAHVAKLRSESHEEVSTCYRNLESGFHLVFKRELCLKQDDLLPGEHKGKRALRLQGHEQLVQAVLSSDDAFKLLGRLLEKGRGEAVKTARSAEEGQHPTKPLIVDVSALRTDAKYSDRQDVKLVPSNSEDRLVASWCRPLSIDFERLQEVQSLRDLHRHKPLCFQNPIQACAFLGGGGGSDVIQAGALAKLLTRASAGMSVRAVISIRTVYSKSTSAGQKRRVWHVEDKSDFKVDLLDRSDGDLQIGPFHRGNARFVEDAIAADFDNVRLVIDDKTQDNLRRRRYNAAIGSDVDSIFIIDTGGDVLGGMDPAAQKKTLDQDCRTQLATAQIAAERHLNSTVAIAAIGVDTPSDAQQKLEASDAVYYRFSADDKRYLTELYSSWHFDGSPESLRRFPERYGKTPFAMLASFKLKPGESGFHALPLPESVINDFDNPWACITWITPEMSCLVFANQAKLLSVIAPAKES